MRIALVNYGHLVHQRAPEQLLDEFEILTGWAEALRAAGAEVTVVQGFSRRASIERSGVLYELVPGRFAPRLSRGRIPSRLHREVLRRAPDVVHLNGLLYAIQARDLRRRLPPTSALVLQHHAERPSRRLARRVQRWGLSRADGFFFSGRELARDWRLAGLIQPEQPVFEIPEGSTHFRCRDRAASRGETGLVGDPVCLWLGNLDANKDPLTVLDGFEEFLAERPRARLYMAHRGGALLPRVEERIASSPELSQAVRRLGELPRERVEAHLNSADLLLQGSHYEGMGYAVIEALACGVIPVVTDIPAFRYLTGDGAVGALWPPGDGAALAVSLRRTLSRPVPELRQAAQWHFERQLSYEALAQAALAAYRRLLGSPTPAPSPPARPRAIAPYLCPECREPVDSVALECTAGHRFERRDGVLVLLSAEVRRQLDGFRAGLVAHRDRLERRILDPAVYDSLPDGQAHDFEWRLRCHDLERVRLLLRGPGFATALDVGSYNGWLARHLAARGCEVTAVDFFADPHDGLGARRFYSRPDWTSIQLDLRDLSILGRTYDLVVLNRCLQFSPDPVQALREAQRRVAPGGRLLVTGLDLYRLPWRKRRSVARLQRRHRERHGRDFFLFPTRGWLGFDDRRRFRSLGLVVREVPELRRLNLLSRVRPDRPRFCYGLWAAPE